mmetsp:Transcript_68984/g.191031  ORF Transcript_68984/g.191031 Transcript_68984/m.191031 type:complete len:212 (+) Transcript_68984:410-1045(+)
MRAAGARASAAPPAFAPPDSRHAAHLSPNAARSIATRSSKSSTQRARDCRVRGRSGGCVVARLCDHLLASAASGAARLHAVGRRPAGCTTRFGAAKRSAHRAPRRARRLQPAEALHLPKAHHVRPPCLRPGTLRPRRGRQSWCWFGALTQGRGMRPCRREWPCRDRFILLYATRGVCERFSATLVGARDELAWSSTAADSAAPSGHVLDCR